MARKGEMKLKCKAYRDSATRIVNKKRRLTKHLKNNPEDKDALNALKNAA